MKVLVLVALTTLLFGESAVGAEKKEASGALRPAIIYAEPGWDSTKFVNGIMTTVIKEGYGYPVEAAEATNVALVQALVNNGVDVHPYIAEISFESYEALRDGGKLIELGPIHRDGIQGVYVPAYMIEGDPARGLSPITPELKSIMDLKKYAKVFADPEDPSKGLFINAPADYLAAAVLNKKLAAYGITDYYNILTPGSMGASDATLDAAFTKGTPWVGYGFLLSYAYSKYPLIKLADERPYDAKLYTPEENYACDFVHDVYMVACSTSFPQKSPELVEFLKKFELSGPIISGGLAYMTDNKCDGRTAGLAWLKNNPEAWKTWVTEEAALRLGAFLDKQ